MIYKFNEIVPAKALSDLREAVGWNRMERQMISIAADKKVIVDTNISVDLLKEISDYNHVAVMLAPQSMSVERFFDRSDPEKQFLLSVIDSCDNAEEVMENYRKGLALINSQENYDALARSGFLRLSGKMTEKIPERKSETGLPNISG